MSSRTTICSPAEVLVALGFDSACTDNNRGMVEMLMPMVDDSIKTFLGWSVIQQSYTHLLPDVDMFDAIAYNSAWDLGEPFDAINGRIAYAYPGMPQVLQLPEIPVRQVNSIYADYSAAGGQGPNDFPAGSLLNPGVDYYVDFQYITSTPGGTTGVSWSGHIRRWLGGVWPARQRSAKVTYVAGLTPDELDGLVSFPDRRVRSIKQAAMLTAMLAFKELKAWGGGTTGTSGPIIAERLADYSVTYSEAAVIAAVGMLSVLPFKVQEILRPFQRSKR